MTGLVSKWADEEPEVKPSQPTRSKNKINELNNRINFNQNKTNFNQDTKLDSKWALDDSDSGFRGSKSKPKKTDNSTFHSSTKNYSKHQNNKQKKLFKNSENNQKNQKRYIYKENYDSFEATEIPDTPEESNTKNSTSIDLSNNPLAKLLGSTTNDFKRISLLDDTENRIDINNNNDDNNNKNDQHETVNNSDYAAEDNHYNINTGHSLNYNKSRQNIKKNKRNNRENRENRNNKNYNSSNSDILENKYKTGSGEHEINPLSKLLGLLTPPSSSSSSGQSYSPSERTNLKKNKSFETDYQKNNFRKDLHRTSSNGPTDESERIMGLERELEKQKQKVKLMNEEIKRKERELIEKEEKIQEIEADQGEKYLNLFMNSFDTTKSWADWAEEEDQELNMNNKAR
ncbi:uncharacterized protein ASCRUDRAFT_77769 [Ascoidea rubescens DSM 1968]|uniref:Uncharacterized protein n=1 Tax=Ascoidea rubescens DSM 1968 TaxID=1344418 RepID=A0A1D2VA38_9ASCO|nr:hypothetical protein ASCRUDRAFT_77769 [Ascoidea rubescens DSM 1968]ODV58514.1 hypothetical protein ASCRUDRAFT_77769 [Ascoidea rubescens DSM 1968]